jgi:hypothetical protein
MSQGLDLVISPAMAAQQPYRLDGMVIAVLPIDDSGTAFRLALQIEAGGPWALLAEMAVDDPDALQEWCAIAVRALDRALMEGMDTLELPRPIRCREVETDEPDEEPEPDVKQGLWQRLRRSFARKQASAS